MSRSSAQEAVRTRTALGIGGLVSIGAILVGLVADGLDVVDTMQTSLFGKTKTR